jgi:hypothetical protein
MSLRSVLFKMDLPEADLKYAIFNRKYSIVESQRNTKKINHTTAVGTTAAASIPPGSAAETIPAQKITKPRLHSTKAAIVVDLLFMGRIQFFGYIS